MPGRGLDCRILFRARLSSLTIPAIDRSHEPSHPSDVRRSAQRTRLDLLNDPATWLWTGFILILAAAGKIGGAILGARMTGQDWRFSLALGALLNTRGLVELIVLSIAYNAHVFSPTLFTMLVVMALVTTAVTVPILNCLRISTIATAEAVRPGR
jgi:Kef-type K+ transport system membrane component KefB